MNIIDLFNDNPELAEDFLLNYMGDKIEEVSELPKMINNIGYIDNKEELLLQTTECEILDIGEYRIKKYDICGEEINVQFDMSFIIQSFVNTKFIWRIQGTVDSDIMIKNDMSYCFENFDPDNYKEYSDLISVKKLKYYDMECDTLYL